MPDEPRSPRVGFSRILDLKATLALGLSVSFGLVILVASGVVLAMDAPGTAIALALAAVLYLPVILTYAELAADKPGSASAYQISRGYGSPALTFLVGWLMLSGLLTAATLLCAQLARRMDFAVERLFQIDVDHVWYLIAAIGLGGLNEWLSAEDRWRSRTVLVWIGFGLFLVVLTWASLVHRADEPGELARLQIQAHDLATVALLAAGLWFVDLLLNHRRQIQHPNRTLRRSLVGVWLGTIALAIAVSRLVQSSPSLLMEFWDTSISWGEARLELLILTVGVLFLWLGLSRLVSRTVRLTGAMTLHGYLPRVGGKQTRRLRALVVLLLLGAVVVLAARSQPSERLLAASAASFLLVTVLVVFPYARRPAKELADRRPNRLPLHPLFPGISVALCVGLVLVLVRVGQGLLIVWILVGMLLYLLYAGRSAKAVLQEAAVIGEVEEVKEKTGPRVLVGAGDRVQPGSLLHLGSAIARGLEAELVVVRVLPSADELSLFTLQRAAESQWQELESAVEKFEVQGVSISTLVRVAPSVAAGILAAAGEYDVDLLLMEAEELPREAPPSATLSRVFASTSRPLVILRGQIHDEPLDVVVGTAGGPHAPLALELGAAIATNTGGRLELVSVVPRAQSDESARLAIETTLAKADLDIEVETRIIEAKTAESGLLEASQGRLLILGSAVDRLLKRTVYEGLPMEIGRAREGATLSVKRAEAAMRFWQRRIWEFLARITPTLTISERSQVFSQMRHSARADTDFYALISLSSAIAILGLLLDSGAVIIGAMLVAPLMSPILAIAQGIVQGSLVMIQRAGASTFKGTAVSIGVATALTAVLPEILPTTEILARTSPNLLDLGVALAAGAAASWAVSRSSVAAALPGVAIAVALVPPLCVVGYGLGTSEFWIAGGAFLLFLTNLAAIVLTGAIVFVLFGFRPARIERAGQVRAAAVVATLTVALLIVPLSLSTVQMSRTTRIETRINEIIRDATHEQYRVEQFAVSKQGGAFLVEGTVYAFQGFETERIFEFQRELERAVGVPVRVQVTVVPAALTVAGGESKGAEPVE